jgi:hypothetical protein
MDNKLLCTEGEARLERDLVTGELSVLIGCKHICTITTDLDYEANAQRIVTAWNCHDKLLKQLGLMTYLVRLKYGNLDKDVYAQINESENLIESLTNKP